VHLAEVIHLRAIPGSAVAMAITQRCPLSCRHCSTNSTLTSRDFSTAPLRRFVSTFSRQSHPELVLMTGGEALLKADLVRWIAETARAVGTRSYLLSGMYFAREQSVPKAVQRAIDSVDHFAASVDAFHEEQVARPDVIRILRQLADAGKDVSVQIVGISDEDPYLAEAVGDLRTQLSDRVPILVGHVGAHGRAAEWLARETPPPSPGLKPDPCMLASWPVVRYDGTIIACCNQDAVDAREIPAHLRLGDASADDWETIRARTLSRDMLRAIRMVGPRALGSEPGAACGYCEACFGLSSDAGAGDRAAELTGHPTIGFTEATMTAMLSDAGPEYFVRSHGSRRYADLLSLGRPR
jgi:pyruvate-formate lyase-activating enzyme